MAENEAQPEGAGYNRTNSGRPYRSHKFPACDFCHRRKSRCIRARPGEPCSLCRLHQRECLTNVRDREGSRRPKSVTLRRVVASSRKSGPSTLPTSGAITRTPETQDAHEVTLGPDGVETSQSAWPVQGSMERQSGHIVGPTLARDAQMLEQYMTPQNDGAVSHVRPNPYSVYSDDPRNPVVYMKVPRHRSTNTSGNGTTGFKQCEIIDNILGHLKYAIFELYFDKIHPAFPVLDQAGVMKAYKQGALPHALTCEIYAVSILFWRLSPAIIESGRPRPDVHYIWNLAVSAMHKDFLSPTFSTVLACILDIWGRPISSVTYNAVNIGSTVALAQSLGLNRDPSKWSLDDRQKSLRIRTWWGLLIHDYWASLCHGTPSHIHRHQWDVPLPELESLVSTGPNECPETTETLTNGAFSFIALCQLTKILGEVLPVIYLLPSDSFDKTIKVLRRIETSLDEWENGLPGWLNAESTAFNRKAPGSLNLRLSFLAMRMCMYRVALQETRLGECDPDEAQYRQARCRKAAASLIDFVTSLSKEETQAFWLPYTAYHFVSAATLMMRCALETQSDDIARNCVERARSLIDYLRKMKDEADWDLANICLGQCEMTVKQMSENGFADFKQRNPTQPQGPAGGGQTRRDRQKRSSGVLEDDEDADTTGDRSVGEFSMLSASNLFPSNVLDTPSGPMIDSAAFQAQMAGDFYFPELWQVGYPDPQFGSW